MNGIDKIYSNSLGMSFYWKNEQHAVLPKIQVVFKDVGFLLTINELKDFSNTCMVTIRTSCCTDCKGKEQCKSLLLRTPSDKIDLAVNRIELSKIHDLLCETIFKVELHRWVKNLSMN